MLERLKKQGYEVIFALDQIDEIALQNVGKFDDVDVVDASKENADLGEVRTYLNLLHPAYSTSTSPGLTSSHCTQPTPPRYMHTCVCGGLPY